MKAATWSGRLLTEALTNIGDPFPGINERPPKVYWRQKDFCDLDTFTPLELYKTAKGEMSPRSYKNEFDEIFARYRQMSLID